MDNFLAAPTVIRFRRDTVQKPHHPQLHQQNKKCKLGFICRRTTILLHSWELQRSDLINVCQLISIIKTSIEMVNQLRGSWSCVRLYELPSSGAVLPRCMRSNKKKQHPYTKNELNHRIKYGYYRKKISSGYKERKK